MRRFRSLLVCALRRLGRATWTAVTLQSAPARLTRLSLAALTHDTSLSWEEYHDPHRCIGPRRVSRLLPCRAESRGAGGPGPRGHLGARFFYRPAGRHQGRDLRPQSERMADVQP